jgi:broad specificity phosphatase PhoE
MRPTRILLVRHGESEGNLDRSTYEWKQDYKLMLTDEGIKHAEEAGSELARVIGNERVFFYVSPMWRTRMTFEHIAKYFNPELYDWKEDPRLREQEWGHFRDLKANIQIDSERNKFGTFYYRIKDGESCADVYDRISDFMSTLHRDFEKPDFPNNAILVTHGMTMRIFLMRWYKWTIEEFESLRNPRNGEVVELYLDRNTGKYNIVTNLRLKNIPEEDKYQWSIVKKKPL